VSVVSALWCHRSAAEFDTTVVGSPANSPPVEFGDTTASKSTMRSC
jgi:hypothetical protein